MGMINLNTPRDRVNQMLQQLVDEGILSDYHGSYPTSLVIAITWVPQEDLPPRPSASAVQLGFAGS